MTASCLKCRGVFDVTHDQQTRAGRCPACHSLTVAEIRNKAFAEVLGRGFSMRDALFYSRNAYVEYPLIIGALP